MKYAGHQPWSGHGDLQADFCLKVHCLSLLFLSGTPVPRQVVASLEATAMATAGNSSKRALLRASGCKTVLSSRSTSFTDGLAIEGGVSVVLNSLTSPGTPPLFVNYHAVCVPSPH